MGNLHVVAVDGSPTGPGRTLTALTAILDGAAASGASTQLVSLVDEQGRDRSEAALKAIGGGDAFLFGSPVYRASFAAPLKSLLDRLPRGMWGETEAPITARATAIALTGATLHHYLALNDLRSVLAGFFAAQVLSPGLYLPTESFTDSKELRDDVAELARAQGAALVELARAIAASPVLGSVRPQA